MLVGRRVTDLRILAWDCGLRDYGLHSGIAFSGLRQLEGMRVMRVRSLVRWSSSIISVARLSFGDVMLGVVQCRPSTPSPHSTFPQNLSSTSPTHPRYRPALFPHLQHLSGTQPNASMWRRLLALNAAQATKTASKPRVKRRATGERP